MPFPPHPLAPSPTSGEGEHGVASQSLALDESEVDKQSLCRVTSILTDKKSTKYKNQSKIVHYRISLP